jgi:hypothetical protein
MRCYVGVTIDELAALLDARELPVQTLFAPTSEFVDTHQDLDEEEREFILSMLAADESLELREVGYGFVVAAEVPTEAIIEQGADSLTINQAVSLDWVACIFLVSPDGEDLTWFAIQEVGQHLPSWRG